MLHLPRLCGLEDIKTLDEWHCILSNDSEILQLFPVATSVVSLTSQDF